MSNRSPPARQPVENQIARKVLTETLQVKRGENVAIETWPHTLPYATAFVYESRRIGAHPLLLLEDEDTYWKSVEELPAASLGTVGTHEWALLSKTDAYVFFPGPSDRARFEELPERSIRALVAYNPQWYARARKSRLRGARVYLSMASDGQARRFGVDPAAWRKELIQGTLANTPQMVQEGRRVSAVLLEGRKVTLDHPNGTHLELRLKGRLPIVQDGVVKRGDVAAGRIMTPVPAGVVAVALDEQFAEGTFKANRPSYLQEGRADGGVWTFRGGKLVDHSYAKGGEGFSKPFRTAGKGRDLPGVLSVGLNPHLLNSPKMEDQERGVVCVGVGGNRGQGGSNDSPFLTWLTLGECDLRVDGNPLLTKGSIQ